MFENIRRALCHLLKCEGDEWLSITYTREYDVNEVLTILRAEFGHEFNLFLSDAKYKSIPKEVLEEILAYDTTDLYRYISEYFDCDDFSYRLMGQLSTPDYGALTFGIAWVSTGRGGHALNVFIDDEENVWMVEPQNDKIFKFPEDWTMALIVM